MSDIVWQAIIGGIVTLMLAYMQYRQQHQLNLIRETTSQTHDLVNSASLVSLRVYAVAARQVAALTDPNDKRAMAAAIKAAAAAEKSLADHEARQARADAGAAERAGTVKTDVKEVIKEVVKEITSKDAATSNPNLNLP